MAQIDDRGFGLIEAIVATPALVVAVAGVFVAVYLCIAQAWLADAAEEAALCTAEKVGIQTCREELESKTSAVLPIGRYSHLSIDCYEQRIVVKYVFETINVNLQNEIDLRLPVSKSAVGL